MKSKSKRVCFKQPTTIHEQFVLPAANASAVMFTQHMLSSAVRSPCHTALLKTGVPSDRGPVLLRSFVVSSPSIAGQRAKHLHKLLGVVHSLCFVGSCGELCLQKTKKKK